jgi:uncharacterized protein
VTFALDVNPLLYASDETSAFSVAAQGVLRDISTGGELVYLFWPVVLGYLRLATNPRIFKAPLTPSVAVANIETLLALPNVRVGAEEDDFLSQFKRTTTGMVVRGDLVPDAHLVALMAQYGLDTVCSHDRDFLKFKGIKIYDPFIS